MSRYSQGVCGDGAMILYDGQPVTIDRAIEVLNSTVAPKGVLLRLSEESASDFFAWALQRAVADRLYFAGKSVLEVIVEYDQRHE